MDCREQEGDAGEVDGGNEPSTQSAPPPPTRWYCRMVTRETTKTGSLDYEAAEEVRSLPPPIDKPSMARSPAQKHAEEKPTKPMMEGEVGPRHSTPETSVLA